VLTRVAHRLLSGGRGLPISVQAAAAASRLVDFPSLAYHRTHHRIAALQGSSSAASLRSTSLPEVALGGLPTDRMTISSHPWSSRASCW